VEVCFSLFWDLVGVIGAGCGSFVWLAELFGKHSSDVNLVPLCLMWTIWKDRNQNTFEDVASSKSQFLECFASFLFDWSCAWGLTFSSSVIHFIVSLSLKIHTTLIQSLFDTHMYTLCTQSCLFFNEIFLLLIKKKFANKAGC
jgi:hypothetical protein